MISNSNSESPVWFRAKQFFILVNAGIVLYALYYLLFGDLWYYLSEEDDWIAAFDVVMNSIVMISISVYFTWKSWKLHVEGVRLVKSRVYIMLPSIIIIGLMGLLAVLLAAPQ
jgi:hypothetical protein